MRGEIYKIAAEPYTYSAMVIKNPAFPEKSGATEQKTLSPTAGLWLLYPDGAPWVRPPIPEYKLLQ